jgi:hypothetical protein
VREKGLDTHTERERREGAIEKDWRRNPPRRCPSINMSSVKTEEEIGKSIESNPNHKHITKERVSK